jgi:hypothetical protein
MKTPSEVLMMKELELQRVKKEIEALRMAVELLGDEKAPGSAPQPKSAKVIQLP